MFKALFYPRQFKFNTDNVRASVTNSMSDKTQKSLSSTSKVIKIKIKFYFLLAMRRLIRCVEKKSDITNKMHEVSQVTIVIVVSKVIKVTYSITKVVNI